MTISLKALVFAICGIVLTYGIVGFAFSDPSPDFNQTNISIEDLVYLNEIDSKNSYNGSFKAMVELTQLEDENFGNDFYGMDIRISDNEKIDRISVGVTNNRIARMEIWNKDILVETLEKGFVGKMTHGDIQNLSIAFYSPNAQKPHRKTTLQVRFYEGSGFLGDIGTLNMDLSKYGNLNGEKSIQLFAITKEYKSIPMPGFTNFQVWKDFESAD